MNLKQNILIPLGYFFNNNSIVNHSYSIDNKSWIKYSYLLQKSLYSGLLLNNNFFNNLKFYSDSLNNSYNYLSDVCLSFRKLPYFSRIINTSIFDIDSSISNYHYNFFYLDLRKRSQFYWISNQSYYYSPEFFINSLDNPLFKELRFYDWRVRWLPKFYISFCNFINLRLFKVVSYFDVNVFKFNAFVDKFSIMFLKLFNNKYINYYVNNDSKIIDKYKYKYIYYLLFILGSNNVKNKLCVIYFLFLKFENSKLFENFILLLTKLFYINNKILNNFTFTSLNIYYNKYLLKNNFNFFSKYHDYSSANNLWYFFNNFLLMKNKYILKHDNLKFKFKNNFSEYFLSNQNYLIKFMFLNQIKIQQYVQDNNLNYQFFDLGYDGFSNLIKVDRSYYVPKINVLFFSNISSKLITGRFLKLSHRFSIENFNLIRWHTKFYIYDKSVVRFYMFICYFSIFNFNFSIFNFLQLNIEYFILKLLFIIVFFFSNIYLPLFDNISVKKSTSQNIINNKSYLLLLKLSNIIN